MKAITIFQPYAHLIVTPQDQLPAGVIHKLVENRSWPTKVRGTIAIHAGKRLNWFSRASWPNVPHTGRLKESDVPEMAFGAIVGVANVVACLKADDIRSGNIPREHVDLVRHSHVWGPWCFVLRDARRLLTPIPCPGAQTFWNVPPDIERQIHEQIV